MTTENTIRATHREREGAVEELRAAYSLGCLDSGELEERTSLAYAAKTRGDLAGLVLDLPRAPEADGETGRSSPLGWPGRAWRRLGRGSWLMLTAAGAWLIALSARGVGALLLIFLWLVALRLCGRLSRRG
jgi:uncharacterized protein DUF1707